MKKIYAILVAACMSVSLFAQAPAQSDLMSFMEDGYYVACFQAPAGTTCNDIYWMGEYVGWNISTELEDLVKCEPLAGFAGWYVAKVPAGNGVNGKPIQLNECGKLTWDVQPGPFDGKSVELVAGSVTIKENGAEYDLEGWSTTEPTIITIGSWKNGYDPCTAVCQQQSYTIRIYPPFCEFLPELEPTIKGSFNQWGDVILMEFKGSYFEYVTEPVTEGFEFKFNNDPAGTWNHEFQHYDAENDSWTNVPVSGNFSLTNGTEFYVRDGNVLTFDFSDDMQFRYKGCDAPEEPEHVAFEIRLPAEHCPEAVEIIGTFDNWAGTALNWNSSTNFFEVELDAAPSNYFKFRSAGAWDQEIEIYKEEDDEWAKIADEQLKFGELWIEAGDHKSISLDFSNPEKYRWTVKEQGIENIVLTEKAQKVVVDGVLYIVRDNKMFNVQGTQVR